MPPWADGASASWGGRAGRKPIALPSCASNFRNLSPSRASLNSHPAISRSTQPRASWKACGFLLPARCLNIKPMEHPSRSRIRCSAMNHERFFPTQHFDLRLSQPKGLELWVTESFTGGVPYMVYVVLCNVLPWDQATDCTRRARLARSTDIAAYYEGSGLRWFRLAGHAQGTGGVVGQASEAIGASSLRASDLDAPHNICAILKKLYQELSPHCVQPTPTVRFLHAAHCN